MKQASRYFIFICLAFLPPHYFSQLIQTKNLSKPGLGIGSEILLPTKDDAILYFGNIQRNKNTISKVDSSGNILWSRIYDLSSSVGIENSKFIDATQSLDSSFAAVGYKNFRQNTYWGDGFCIKFKPNGDTLWCHQLNKSPYVNIIPLSINSTIDSGFVLSGAALLSYTVSGAWQHSFVAKLSKTGGLEWLKTYANSYADNFASSVKQSNDSGYIVIGGMENGGVFRACATIMKLDKTGNSVWSKKYCDASVEYGIGLDIQLDKKGYKCLISAGSPCLLSIDSIGNQDWAKSYYPSNFIISEEFKRDMNLKKTSDNGYLIVGNTGSCLIRADSLGLTNWYASASLTNIDAVSYSNKNIAIIGNPVEIYVRQNAQNSYDNVGLFIIDELGSSSSPCYYKGSVNQNIVVFDTSSFHFTSIAGGNLSTLSMTMSSLSLDSKDGCLEQPTDIRENSLGSLSVFPNPSSGKITLISSFSQDESYSFELKDIFGRIVFCKKHLNQRSELELDLSHLSNAIYFYSITKEIDVVKSGKLIISK